eukprot:4015372-Pyramimonas_sp.AAC.1
MDVCASEASAYSKPIRILLELRPALIEYDRCASSFNRILLGAASSSDRILRELRPARIESY